MILRRFVCESAAAVALAVAGPASSADLSDPFSTQALTTPSAGAPSVGVGKPCSFDDAAGVPISLGGLVDRALCNNPQTRVAWANARIQAAQVGIARSAYLPTISAGASATRNRARGQVAGASSSGTTRYSQEDAGLSVSYLLYDFGARDAALEGALQTLAAANFTQSAALQTVLLSTVQSYYQLFGARAAVDSTKEAERSALESLKAATARYDAGTGTPADKYQAQTAYSQAVLNRIQAEGNAQAAQGALSNVIGLDADRTVNVEAPRASIPDASFDDRLSELISTARKQRPDLAATEAQVRAAQAGVVAARAAGMPSISLSGDLNYSNSSLTSSFQSSAIGIAVTIPLFTGFKTTYQVRAAEAQAESRAAQRDGAALQVALDVWQAYYSLKTSSESVHSSADLVKSAAQSERVALGRYKAGAGTILDLLAAQSALASARLQNIQAVYGWHIAKATLAQALGQLDIASMGETAERP